MGKEWDVLKIRLIHWNAGEAEERAERLRALGYDVDCQMPDGAGLRRMREDPPGAVVVDLGRLPSQGRDMAIGIRTYKATRHVPLVFVAGDPHKVARVRELLPDAIYTTWAEMGPDLARAIAEPPRDPVVPRSTMAAYAGVPLPKKLGVKQGSLVMLAGAAEGFEETLGELPKGATVQRGDDDEHREPDVTLWFVRSREELERDIEAMGAFAAKGGLWIAWPKKSSGVTSDLSQTVVRRVAMASGLVDFKVCAIDKTWSGLRFTRRS